MSVKGINFIIGSNNTNEVPFKDCVLQILME